MRVLPLVLKRGLNRIEAIDKMKDTPSPLFETLQIFPDRTLRSGPQQMALDEVILETASVPVLRVYAWSELAVSFGYSQSCQMVEGLFPGRPLVRRWTGGGVVEHGLDWTFSLMVPMSAPAARLRPAETYEKIHEAVLSALAVSGVSTRLARCEDRSVGAACFVAPALHDVLTGDGRKLCGGAQRRNRHGFLHQGSVQGVNVPLDFTETLARGLARESMGFELSVDAERRAGALAVEKYDSIAWREKIP